MTETNIGDVTLADIAFYVVNLRRRPDRKAQIAAQLPANVYVRYTSDWDGPFDGHDLTVPGLQVAGFRLWPWQIDSDNPWWSRPLKFGEIGCSLAHHACWRDVASRNAAYTVVLEDDAILSPTFADDLVGLLGRLGRPPVFDLLYLGRFPLTVDAEPDLPGLDVAEPGAGGLVTPGYSHCTFGYLLTREGINKVLSAELETAIVPVDEFLPALYHPHPRHDLRRRFPPRLRALACEPPLVTQRPKNEAGSDTEDSPFVPDEGGDDAVHDPGQLPA